MKYLINVDELPEEIEAKDLEEAEKIVLENISILELSEEVDNSKDNNESPYGQD